MNRLGFFQATLHSLMTAGHPPRNGLPLIGNMFKRHSINTEHLSGGTAGRSDYYTVSDDFRLTPSTCALCLALMNYLSRAGGRVLQHDNRLATDQLMFRLDVFRGRHISERSLSIIVVPNPISSHLVGMFKTTTGDNMLMELTNARRQEGCKTSMLGSSWRKARVSVISICCMYIY